MNDLVPSRKKTGNVYKYVILCELLRISISIAKAFSMKGRVDNDGINVSGNTAHSDDELDESWRQIRSSER
jgi:hypothetical protein